MTMVQSGGGQAGMVYDLYGVVNHIGGMTGGHYTAFCRSSPCSKDGVEEVTGWGLEHPWLQFDDEFVEVGATLSRPLSHKMPHSASWFAGAYKQDHILGVIGTQPQVCRGGVQILAQAWNHAILQS